MSSRFLSSLFVALAIAVSCNAQPLRVCADPDNLPFSDRLGRGFDNHIAELVARDLHMKLSYEWQRNGRGFVREYLNKGRCDVLVGVPTAFRPVLTTQPYYRAGYVFVSRKDRRLHLNSFDDPQLQRFKIGVQIAAENYTPPGQALARRGLATNIVPFETGGKQSDDVLEAVLRKQIDVAVVWGPLAGDFARRHPGRLELAALPEVDTPGLPMEFSISLGVSKKRPELRDRLNAALERNRKEIKKILRRYGVPLEEEKVQAQR